MRGQKELEQVLKDASKIAEFALVKDEEVYEKMKKLCY